MGKWLIPVLIGAILLVVIFAMRTNLDPSGQGSKSAANTASQTQVYTPMPATGNTGAQIGTSGAGTTLTGHQCRVTCRGKCGGANPAIRITRAQKARHLCHKNCRVSICNFISESDYNNG